MNVTTIAGIVLLLPAAAWPADSIKPLDAKLGLWESSATSEISGMPATTAMPQIPEATLAKMPPEQRARLEAMMKSRATGQPMTTKVCITRESLSSGAFAQRDKSCTTKVVTSSSTKQVIHFDCSHDEMKSSGDMTMELVEPGSIKGTMVMNSQGRDVKTSFASKWLGPDCGNVKPAVAK